MGGPARPGPYLQPPPKSPTSSSRVCGGQTGAGKVNEDASAGPVRGRPALRCRLGPNLSQEKQGCLGML